MVLTHIQARAGEVLVMLPNGETRWVAVSDLIALAESDKRRDEPVNDEPVNDEPKGQRKRKLKS
jgi:hypothetical protein